MAEMKQRMHFWKDTRGYAVVEATILFPIILMSFAGLVLLSMYLPTRAVFFCSAGGGFEARPR